MVSKNNTFRFFTIVLLLISTTAQATLPRIVLNWSGEKTGPCQKMVEAFLTELRAMASDRIIELEAVKSVKDPEDFTEQPTQNLLLRCSKQEPGKIEISDGTEVLTLRFVPKAAGFDATDWISFQRKYLRPEALMTEAALAPAKTALKENLISQSSAALEIKEENKSSLLQKWWFWGLIAATGAGAYLATRPRGNSGMSVEIR